MTYWKQYIILFGGFQDTSNQTKYMADLWIFDTQNFTWFSPVLPAAQLKPDARSSFTFLPHENGAVLYGGYSRVKATVAANKQAKGSSQGQKNILKPLIHEDCFFLRMAPPPEGSPPNTLPSVRWERRKKPANSPNPRRAGTTMAYHKGRGIMFGGVHDVEQSEDGMDSEFFRELYAWNIERNRFFPMVLRKARQQKKAGAAEQRGGGRRARAQDREEELLKQLAALETGTSLEDADAMDLDTKGDEKEDPETSVREMPITMELPHPRFNAQLAIQDDVLYIFGGTFEQKDREFTFDDLYAVDLGKMDGCKEIYNKPVEDWIVSYLQHKSTGLGLTLRRNQRTRRTTRMMKMRKTKRMTRMMKCPMMSRGSKSRHPARGRRSRTMSPVSLARRRPRMRKHPRRMTLTRPRLSTMACHTPG
jgi:hypothetical protein